MEWREPDKDQGHRDSRVGDEGEKGLRLPARF